jgi:hypothetical protein
VFENRVPWGTYVPKKEDITDGQRKQHNEQLHNLYSYEIILGIKSLMRWVGQVACMDEKYIKNFSWKTWKEKTTWENKM